MIVQAIGISRYDFTEKGTLFFILSGYKRGKFHGQVSAIVYKIASQFPSFPPPVVGSIGTKYKQHRNGETKQALHDGNIFYIAIGRQVPVTQFQECDDAWIYTNTKK